MGARCVSGQKTKMEKSVEQTFAEQQQVHEAQKPHKQNPMNYTQSIRASDDVDINLLQFDLCPQREKNINIIKSKNLDSGENSRKCCSEILISLCEEGSGPKSILRSRRNISLRPGMTKQKPKSVSFSQMPIQGNSMYFRFKRISKSLILKNN